MSEKDSLTRRTLHAAKWGYLGAAGKLLIQLGSQVLLARILGPAEYGMFAVGAIVVGVATFFADASIGSALVQRKEINDEIISFISTWQLITGAFVTTVLFLFAHHITEFLTHPEATYLLRVLSFVCLISAATSVPNNLLRRQLNFKTLQVSQLMGFAIGYLFVGIPMALMGGGVWSLVTAWLVQAFCTFVLLWRAVRPPFAFRLSAADGFSTLKFGGNALLSNIATWSGSNLDRLIVSRAFSAQELGIYHVVNNLVSTAISQIISTLQSVTFSSSSKISSDQNRIRNSFLTTIEAGPIIILPLFATVAIASKIVLIGLYGTKWQKGIELLRPIALAASIYGLSGTITPLLWASDKIKHESGVQIISSVLTGIACYVAAIYGNITTVAWALFVVTFLRYTYFLQFAASTFEVPANTVFRHLSAGILTTLLCGTGALAVTVALDKFLASYPEIILFTTILACAVIWILSATVAIRFVASPQLRDTVRGLVFKRRKTTPQGNTN